MTRRKIVAAAVALCALVGGRRSRRAGRRRFAYECARRRAGLQALAADAPGQGTHRGRADARARGQPRREGRRRRRGARSGRAGLRRPGVSVRGHRHRPDARGVERRREGSRPRARSTAAPGRSSARSRTTWPRSRTQTFNRPTQWSGRVTALADRSGLRRQGRQALHALRRRCRRRNLADGRRAQSESALGPGQRRHSVDRDRLAADRPDRPAWPHDLRRHR